MRKTKDELVGKYEHVANLYSVLEEDEDKIKFIQKYSDIMCVLIDRGKALVFFEFEDIEDDNVAVEVSEIHLEPLSMKFKSDDDASTFFCRHGISAHPVVHFMFDNK